MALPGGGELQAKGRSNRVLPTAQGPTQSRCGHRTPSSGPLACGDLTENTTVPTQCPTDPTFSMASGSPMESGVPWSCWLLKATVTQGQPHAQPKGAPSDQGADAFASTGPRADSSSWVLRPGHGRGAPLSAFDTLPGRQLITPAQPRVPLQGSAQGHEDPASASGTPVSRGQDPRLAPSPR